MKACIVDNENNIVDGLKQMIAVYCPNIRQVLSANTVKEAVSLLESEKVNILFLDVELDDGTGMEVLDRLQDHDLQVIFMTAHDKYAVDAFKFSAIDFLLKPIDPDDLIEAVNKAEFAIEAKGNKFRLNNLFYNFNEMSLQEKKIVISDKDFVRAIKISDIFYLMADGAYTKFTTKSGNILSSKNLKWYSELLEDVGFIRTHHSYMVNLRHMTHFDKSGSVLILENHDEVPVSHRKKDNLIRQIKNSSLV